MTTTTLWPVVPVTDCLAPLKVRKTHKILAREYARTGIFPIVDQGQDLIAGWTNDESAAITEQLPFIVFGDHTRIFKYVNFPFALGADGTQLLKPGNEFNPYFFYFACLNVDLPSRGYNRHFSILKEKQLPKPLEHEQQKIAAVLWNVQRALETEEKLIATSRELKQSTMRQIFTHGLRGEAQQETEIGLIPDSWKPRTILELCEIWSGGTPRKSISEYWSGNIPWVSGKDLKRPSLDDAIDHISVAGVESACRLAPQGAVLLLVRGMGLAKDLPVAVINRPMTFNQDVKALVTRGEYSGRFLRSVIYAGKERLLSRIVPSAHGTMTLNLDDIENFKVACPSDPNEATEIVAIFDALDLKISLHERRRLALKELFKTLLHKLMSGDIRVADLDIDICEVTQ